jgi:uncharacterized membrane protein (DUF2068 family)
MRQDRAQAGGRSPRRNATTFSPNKMQFGVVIMEKPSKLRHHMDPLLPPTPSQEARYLRWIALLNLGKGLLLCLLAIGLLGFLHKDVDTIVGNWMSLLGFNMENRHVVRLLARLDRVTDRQLAEMSGITFALAGIFVTEGTGLLLRQQWAKYLTIAFTASFIPIEVMESIKHFGWLKLALLIVNIAVVAVLATMLARERKRNRLLMARSSVPQSQAAVRCESV